VPAVPRPASGRHTLTGCRCGGDERELDAGCGTGRDTQGWPARLPRGPVAALDGSVRMPEQLREQPAGRPDRVAVVPADRTGPLLSEALHRIDGRRADRGARALGKAAADRLAEPSGVHARPESSAVRAVTAYVVPPPWRCHPRIRAPPA
jgi:hypothetical protein